MKMVASKVKDSELGEQLAARIKNPKSSVGIKQRLIDMERKLFGIEPVVTKQSISNADIQIVVEAVIILSYFAYSEEEMTSSQRKQLKPILTGALPIMAKSNIDPSNFDVTMGELLKDGMVSDSADNLSIFLKELLQWEKSLKTIFTMSPLLLELLNAARRMAAGSDSAYDVLEKKIGQLKNPALTHLFADDYKSNPQEDILPSLAKYVKQLGGKGYALDVQQRKVARIKDPGRYDLYMKARSTANKAAEEFRRNWVRKHSDEDGLASYADFLKALNQNQIVVHPNPTGFKGYLDDTGAWYTIAKKKIMNKPGPGRVEMNPNYDPKKDDTNVFKAFVDGAETTSMYYTVDFKTNRTGGKFEAVEALSQAVDGMRKKWLAVIKAGDIDDDENDREFLSACVLEIIYQCQARIGGVGNNTKDPSGVRRQTFGLSTILMKHVRATSAGLTISYEGKAAFKGGTKAVKQKHVLTAEMGPAVRKIIKALVKWKAERKANDPVWMTNRGGPLSASSVNDLFKRVGAPEGTTIHKMRTLKGTVMMKDILDKHPWKGKKTAESTIEVTNWLKDKALAIGKQLGHHAGESYTSSTAITSYCNPKMMMDLYKEADVMPSKQMLQLVMGDSNKGIEG